MENIKEPICLVQFYNRPFAARARYDLDGMDSGSSNGVIRIEYAKNALPGRSDRDEAGIQEPEAPSSPMAALPDEAGMVEVPWKGAEDALLKAMTSTGNTYKQISEVLYPAEFAEDDASRPGQVSSDMLVAYMKTTIDDLYSIHPDTLTISNVCSRVEVKLGLEAGFLSVEPWKERSQQIFSHHAKKKLDEARNDANRSSRTDHVDIRLETPTDSGRKESKSSTLADHFEQLGREFERERLQDRKRLGALSLSDDEIIAGLYATIDDLYTSDPEHVTIFNVRTRAEAELALEPGSLSGEPWNEKSQKIIRDFSDDASKRFDVWAREDLEQFPISLLRIRKQPVATSRRYTPRIQPRSFCTWHGCGQSFGTGEELYQHMKAESHQSLQAIPQTTPDLILESQHSLPVKVPRSKVPGLRCGTCDDNGQEVWVIPGRMCPVCGSPYELKVNLPNKTHDRIPALPFGAEDSTAPEDDDDDGDDNDDSEDEFDEGVEAEGGGEIDG
ncbi:uncharacterized protein RCO7_15196 [Rhynchosporium graminicola]|uniref:C2H2-type domain-containing protein n=1 Tax=Rhynchosporium graminicola TaxID=2792576 RepID=A0A1E1LQP0_9HELO|nr:uncharacterized protein RCO7_15196 [Rhynchosporium commune]